MIARLRRLASSRARSGWLWLLAALLGAATLWSSVTLIHGRGEQKRAARELMQSVARDAVARAESRLRVAALETFAPVLAWPAEARRSPVETLVQVQREALRCRCRVTLPATGFFRLDLAAGTFALIASPDSASGSARGALESIARTAAVRDAEATLPIAITPDPGSSHRAVLTVVQSDSAGAPAVVYGTVMDATAVMRMLFAPDSASSFDAGAPGAGRTMDPISLRIADANGRVIYGGVDPRDSLVATVRPEGMLAALAVTVAARRPPRSRGRNLEPALAERFSAALHRARHRDRGGIDAAGAAARASALRFHCRRVARSSDATRAGSARERDALTRPRA